MAETTRVANETLRSSNHREAKIENHTGLPHFWFEQSGPEGQRLDVLVVRGTFNFASGGSPLTLARHQSEIAYGDQFDGALESEVMRAIIANDGDLVPYKPGTDILVYGHASAPGGKPHASWIAGLRVGPCQQFVRLHGPRSFRRGIFGWSVTSPKAVTRIKMDFRLAYGGCVDVPANLTSDGQADWVRLPSNPAGRGWLPDSQSYAHLPSKARRFVAKWVRDQHEIPAPQIEDALTPVRTPFCNVPARGLGPIARWWQPRIAYQGKYDETVLKSGMARLPVNFDTRFFQSANAMMVATPHLVGDENISFVGLLADKTDMRLPGWKIIAVTTHASGACNITFPLLDTLRLDLDRTLVSLVWRAHFSYNDPVINVVVGATTAAIVNTEPTSSSGEEII
ncbi:DUF2169 family type VI secretion system accessory protein [Massilia aquatica]|uniref:DUF2169 domain-containing protein n=1 Tax=Massilia aquatica TaxID=2609000 RepID=A0ABX0LUW8_9BURK|nr:DUF2169 domain-containing protein [Massilia aquatica]NHZ38654.1 DUF2169 domain-containing protein [Massilia aquatica]